MIKNYNRILEINKLNVFINEIRILNNLNLKINKGEIHVIMGKNGSGKSTLSKVIAGHPAYSNLDGKILFNNKNILDLDPETRSLLGIFLAFQYPIEISGVTNEDFLRLAYNSKQFNKNLKEINPIDFLKLINDKLKTVDINSAFLSRNVNEGFSGGEKKRNEILQMILLNSSLCLLDETDSGLDIDALKIISDGINYFISKNKSIIIITHYKRILDYIKPDFIHIMKNGEIIKTGDYSIASELETIGYNLNGTDEI
jgi:Fe-S cluster assembly ATP-binding protein